MFPLLMQVHTTKSAPVPVNNSRFTRHSTRLSSTLDVVGRTVAPFCPSLHRRFVLCVTNLRYGSLRSDPSQISYCRDGRSVPRLGHFTIECSTRRHSEILTLSLQNGHVLSCMAELSRSCIRNFVAVGASHLFPPKLGPVHALKFCLCSDPKPQRRHDWSMINSQVSNC